jgi:peptidoglycan hydrolase-like protein with peptidoglycan-binding domain
MEKPKPTLFDVLHNWNNLKVSQKRAVLTVALFALAGLLLLIAMIIGIASCGANRAADAEAEAVQIPAILLPPERTVPQKPDAIEPDGTKDPDDPEDGTEDPDDPEDGTETADPGSGAEATAATYKVLKKHDSGEEVTALQNRLMELGYLEIEEPTDYFGNSTAYAVQLFQRQHGLEQDGVAGEQTQTLLFGKDAQHYMMVEGAEGRDVKMLQEQLVDLGYLSEDDVDRIYGAKTIEAVKAFQKRNGLTADGKAGEKTLEKLYSDGAKISKSLEEKLKAEEKAQKEKERKEAAAAASKKPGKTATPTPKKDSKLDKFLKAANSKIGCEYVLGDKGPNTFDCSGFVYYCLKQAGVSTIRMNAAGFSKVSRWKNVSKISDLEKGDILFFRSDSSSTVSHCGIYIGSGMMIDASSANGKVVKRAVSSYWKRNFVNARRPW